jgi:hypothetical protein
VRTDLVATLVTRLYQAQTQVQSQSPATSDWTVNLGWRDFVALAGVLIGIAGLVIAWFQYKKAESAGQAVKQVHKTLFRQKAAQHFTALEPKAILLSNAVRGRRWDEAAELSTVVGAMLVNAAGYCSPLMNVEDNANLELAATGLRYLSENLPIDSNPIDQAIFLPMRTHCVTILFNIERIAGRMRSLDEFEGQ